MLVEDDEGFRSILRRFLVRKGLNVVDTGRFDDALALARSHHPASILLDLTLGDASGMNLIHPLKALLPDSRIVILTGSAEISLAVNAIKLGASDFLLKPSDGEVILAKLLDKNNTQAQTPAESPMPLPLLEREHLRKVLADHRGNITHAARALRIQRRTLQRKLSRFGINPEKP